MSSGRRVGKVMGVHSRAGLDTREELRNALCVKGKARRRAQCPLRTH